MEWTEILNLVIAGLALLVSWRAFRKANSIERGRRADEIRERDSASIRAHCEPYPDSNRGRQIVIENFGKADAQIVDIQLDGLPLSEHRSTNSPDQTIERIPSGSKVFIVLKSTMAATPPKEFHIKWSDDFKKENEETFALACS